MPKDFANTQELVAVEDIKNSTVILKDGSLRQIVMVGGINFALKSQTEQEVLAQAYQNFLNGVDFPLQILIHSRKINIDKYLESLSKHRERETSALLQNQIDEYQEFIRSFVQKNAIMEKTFLVIVPFFPFGIATTETIGKFLPFLGKKKDAAAEAKTKEEAEANFEENLAQLRQRVSQVQDGLSTIGLDTAVLDDEQLVELFYNFYNPETVEKEEINLPK